MGKRVIAGDRTQPIKIVDIGVRTKTDERIPKTIETLVVRVHGDWVDAVDRVLVHKLTGLTMAILHSRSLATIVACEDDSLDRGGSVTVRRASEVTVNA